MNLAAASAPLARRLWQYQGERFPVFKHGAAIAAFAGSAALLPGALGGTGEETRPWAIIVAAIISLLFFLQLRVADEHKDFADDCKFRPERPVPRGLVGLEELRWVAIGAALVQIVLATLLDPVLLLALALVWVWMALMTAEFFAPQALKARPLLYMISHMAVMPLMALFALACGSLDAAQPMQAHALALGAFLALAFVNGVAMEIARKCWAPRDERAGVETYSKLWGPRAAAITTAVAIIAGLALSLFVQRAALMPAWGGAAAALFAALGVAAAIAFALEPTPRRAKWLEHAASFWVLACYVLLAAGAMIASGGGL